jgi:ribosomal protein S18 acetylase RimI-like enzyme
MARGAVSGAWESLSVEERLAVAPEQVAAQITGQMQEFLAGPGGMAIIAMLGQTPVAFITGAVGPDTSTEESHGHLLTVWVAPAHRRRGLARGLLALAEQHFSSLGLRKVKIWTPEYNGAAVSLARRSGFQPEGLIGMKRLQGWPVMHLSDTVT